MTSPEQAVSTRGDRKPGTGGEAEVGDPRGVLRRVRRHVRHLSADRGAHPGAALLPARAARPGHHRDLHVAGLRHHARRPADRRRGVRRARRPHRAPAQHDHLGDGLRRDHAAHRPGARLHDDRDRVVLGAHRAAVPRRDLPRRRVHRRAPAGHGVLDEEPPRAARRDHPVGVPAGLRRDHARRPGVVRALPAGRARLPVRRLGLARPVRARRAARLRPRGVLRAQRVRVGDSGRPPRPRSPRAPRRAARAVRSSRCCAAPRSCRSSG